MIANETQVGGTHYQAVIQTWDYILSHDLGFLEGNIIKYVTRYRKKNGVQDLEKALHYLNKLIEVEHDRLQHTHTDTNCPDEPDEKAVAEKQHRSGPRNVFGDAGRVQAVNECDQTFIPRKLGDII